MQKVFKLIQCFWCMLPLCVCTSNNKKMYVTFRFVTFSTCFSCRWDAFFTTIRWEKYFFLGKLLRKSDGSLERLFSHHEHFFSLLRKLPLIKHISEVLQKDLALNFKIMVVMWLVSFLDFILVCYCFIFFFYTLENTQHCLLQSMGHKYEPNLFTYDFDFEGRNYFSNNQT